MAERSIQIFQDINFEEYLKDEGWRFQVVELRRHTTNDQMDICDCKVAFATENTESRALQQLLQIQLLQSCCGYGALL